MFFNNLFLIRISQTLKSWLIGSLLACCGFFVPWIISHNLSLAIMSGVFWIYSYVGYYITESEKELRAKKFCHFSFRLSSTILIISIMVMLLRDAKVNIGEISLALSWPLFTMGIILFILSTMEEIGLILDLSEKIKQKQEES